MYSIEDRNYANDPRVQARDEEPWFLRFNERTMTAWVVEQDDDDETERPVKCRYEVCDICNGKGTHVNPSIDCGGLTSEDFDEDPDFAECYFDGMFDVTCYGCKGKRVVPVPIA
jgi:hypothetical protein